ncbi:hypothetical protein V6N13_135387 [Hibiscus sabdariffa]
MSLLNNSIDPFRVLLLKGHWRFPSEKAIQGYAYTLTHPGTSSMFYDNIISNHHFKIDVFISLRNIKKNPLPSVAKMVVYVAIIDDKVAMKVELSYYEPSNGRRKWSSTLEGYDYKVWEASS